VPCDDSNPCTYSSCSPLSGCGPQAPAVTGSPCPGGICDNGACVACLTGQTEFCNPQCGTFNGSGDGYRTCSNGSWGTCQPVACAPGTPTYYTAVPVDHAWHCNPWAWPNAFTMFMCLRATPTYTCGAPSITFEVQKAANMNGTNFGPFDNNVSIHLTNVNTGVGQYIPSVSCAGQTVCSFSVAITDLFNTFGLNGSDGFSAEIRSPPGTTYVGTTAPASVTTCN
jgi:hypothetical protein